MYAWFQTCFMSLKKNIFANFLLSGSTIIFPLITFPYITRILSTSSLGKIFLVDAFTSYLIIFSSIGIPFYGVREIAKLRGNREGISKLVTELITIQLTLSIFFCGIFLACYSFVPALESEPKLVAIACLTVIANAILIEWFFQGIENFAYITRRSLVVKVLSIIAILLYVKSDTNYILYYLILALLVVINSLFNFGFFFKKYFVSSAISWKNLKFHFRPLFVLFSINISLSIYTIMDTIILGFLSNAENVSAYNISLKMVKIFWLLVGSVSTVLIPRMSNLIADDNLDGVQDLMTKSLNVVFLLTIPFAAYCLIFPEIIIQIVSGDKYIYTANALRILSLVPLIIGVCNVMGTQYLMPRGHEKKLLYATILGLVISLSLNFILIPFLGYLGSCIACILAELTVCLYLFVAARKQIKIKYDYNLLSMILLCVMSIFIFSYLLEGVFSGLVMLFSSVAVYIIVFVLLQFLVFKNKFLFKLINFRKIL